MEEGKYQEFIEEKLREGKVDEGDEVVLDDNYKVVI